MEGASILDIMPLFTDRLFRARALTRVGSSDPVAREFWREYEELSPSAKRELTAPIFRRMRSLYRNPAIRNIFGQKTGMDFAEFLSKRKIVLCATAGQAITSEAALIGEVLISKMHLAAQARLDTPEENHPSLLLCVDELHNHQGASLPILLRDGRKMGFDGTIAITQHLSAWDENLAEAVLANNGNLIAFRLGPTDAKALSHMFHPFTVEHLISLERHTAVGKLQVQGHILPPVHFRTEPPPAFAAEQFEQIQAASRERYTKPRREVEEGLNREYTSMATAADAAAAGETAPDGGQLGLVDEE